ncbi:GNAT family N-acetyltransferase [Laceyella putida]|uniref:GNAT family N-acetyltransferase n=1 Tax=Laceyella putida TaxID=110101 RepID=A0ABW2RM05_9BACL
MNEIIIKEVIDISPHIHTLSDLLVKVVNDGASIGFLPPLEQGDARDYWLDALKPEVILLVATLDHETVGSVQLHLCPRPNGKHRAEIAKLMVHPRFRRKGIGRMLMEHAERKAKHEKRSLLVLDTREGDPSNHLYRSLGYIEAGRIPQYAESAGGILDNTIFYYKQL